MKEIALAVRENSDIQVEENSLRREKDEREREREREK